MNIQWFNTDSHEFVTYYFQKSHRFQDWPQIHGCLEENCVFWLGHRFTDLFEENGAA